MACVWYIGMNLKTFTSIVSMMSILCLLSKESESLMHALSHPAKVSFKVFSILLKPAVVYNMSLPIQFKPINVVPIWAARFHSTVPSSLHKQKREI